ncbi:MAG: YceI family protein [Verrucomicrobia bacterium]|nr:YceI family protein [Verrucomicrobiota bacterium]
MKILKPVLILSAALICFNSSHAIAQDSSKWKGACEITFFGKSTLHDFAGTVNAEPFVVTISNMTDKSNASASSKVTVKAVKMDTASKKRDANMHDVMKVSTFTDIVVDVINLKPDNTKPVFEEAVPRPTIIPFTLTIKGKKQQLTGTVSAWFYSEDTIKCTVSFPVSLKTSGIVVPTVLGFIKVDDQILVDAKLTLKKT